MGDLNKIDVKKVKNTVDEFLKKITPQVQVTAVSLKDSTVCIEAKSEDPQLLIGSNAETLMAIQHLLKVILRKTVDQMYYVDLDINSYKKKRKDYLKELAVSSANDVALAKKEIVLAPMTAYERRIIHMELSDRQDVVTESRGQDSQRRVVIRPGSR